MRRLATATLAGLTVFGLVNGLAASMQVNDATLGSDTVVTAACDGAITMAYGVATGATGHQVTEVTFSDVDAACDGKIYYLDVLDTNGVVLTSKSSTVSLASNAFTVTLDSPAAAADVAGANITITG